uniref:Uncharacterized protein n=1 Tax=Cucumis melo TaxID=3656 RepID=A0A9I9E5J1_CUCME
MRVGDQTRGWNAPIFSHVCFELDTRLAFGTISVMWLGLVLPKYNINIELLSSSAMAIEPKVSTKSTRIFNINT